MQPVELELYEEAVVQYRRLVHHFSTQLVAGDRSLAEDLTQEAYCRLWLRWSTIEQNGHIKGWLLTTVRRLAIDRIRVKRHQEIAFSTCDMELQKLTVDDHVDQLLDRFDAEDVLACLPDQNAEAICLFSEGWEYGEIAATQEVPVGTVKSRINQARARARQTRPDLAMGRGRARAVKEVQDGAA